MVHLEMDHEPEPTPLPTREEVLAEIADWKQRIDALYRDVIGWLPQGMGYEVDLSWVAPVYEQMLQALELPPYEVPMLQIRHRGRRVLIFRPDGRWVMFTRGRVRIGIGNDRWETLLAKEDDNGRVHWVFWDADSWKRSGDPWSADILHAILEGRR